jgi:hypothetical protein
VRARQFRAACNPAFPFTIFLLCAWGMLPSAAESQETCTQTQEPLYSPAGLDGPLPTLIFLTTTIKVFSKGHLIGVLVLRQGDLTTTSGVEVDLDGMPFTSDPLQDPNGTYSQSGATALVNGICPNGVVNQTRGLQPKGRVPSPRLSGTPASGTPASGQAASQYAYGDFNGDGYVDTAAAVGSAAQITLFGAGGTVLSKTTIPIASGLISSEIVIADFNGDGNLDLAVVYVATSQSGQGGVAILLGNGDGTFGMPTTFPAGSGPNLSTLAVGDFNGDGKLDLAVSGYIEIDQPFISISAQVGILLGNGDGTFAPPVMANTPSMVNAESIVCADFNGDGNLDLAVLDWQDREPDPDKLWVLPGNGDGTFGTPVGTIPGTGRGYLSYTDLNHDGNMDLVIADPNSNGMATLLGNGDGTFLTPTLYVASAQQGGVSLGVAPLADGTTAIFTPDDLTNGVLLTFAGPDGTVISPVIQPLGKGLSGIAAADVNGDGQPDLLITDATAGNLSVLLGTGTGQFGAPATYALGSKPLAVASADLNHDGNADAVVSDARGIDVLLGDGNGGFGALTTYPAASGQLSSVALADFNQDGNLDVAATNSGGLSLFEGQGNGTFGTEQVIPFSGGNIPTYVVAADLNGDGTPDLIAGFIPPFTTPPQPGGFSILLGAGDGTFSGPMDTLLPGSFAGGLAVADVNGDGVPDVIASSADQFLRVQIAVFLGNGDGTFQSPLLTSTGTSGGMLLVTDLDGDGKPDLIVADCSFNAGRSCGSSEPSFMLGRGDGTFQPELRFSAGPGASALAVADFNGDGKPDLAAANHRTIGERGALTVLMNAFPAASNPAITAPAVRK